ncbi:MAG: hypothetical protein ACUVSK_05175 [Desulfotomaculales bacterium]
MDREQMQSRRKQWEKFNTWEASDHQALIATNLTELLNWYGKAWELARELDPAWAKPEVDREKVRQIQRIRTILTRLGGLS